MKLIVLRILLFFWRYTVWESWNGWGITTNWPHPQCQRQISRLRAWCRFLLPNTHCLVGPEFAAGGSQVLYIWPKRDPRVERHIAEQGE